MQTSNPNAMRACESHAESNIQAAVQNVMEFEIDTAYHGDKAENLMIIGFEFTSRMLEAMMAVGDISLLEDQFQWARERLCHEGVLPEHILHLFDVYRQAAKQHLPASVYAEVEPYLDWMLNRQQEITQIKFPGREL